MLKLICACFVLFTFSWSNLQGQTSAQPATNVGHSQEAVVFEQIKTKIDFENDGTGIRETTVRVRIQSEAGVQRLGVLTVSYQSLVEGLEIPYVRVRKPDGTIVTTPPENIQDMASEITRQAPFYSDLREKHIAVKGLSPGDVLEYQFRSQLQKPLAPGQFWSEYNFVREGIALDEKLEVSVPRARAIKYKSVDVQPSISDEGTRRIYTWAHANLENKPKEDEKLEKLQERVRGRLPPPDVQISSFGSWEEVGRWYDGLQKDRVKPTPEIRAKAAELTKSASDDEAKIHAIYDYVSTRFHYIGIALGIGRYQPHAASEVLSNGYGDCKDKHTLFSALLDAVGIKSYPALISSSRSIDPDIPSPAQFDHVIDFLPRGSTSIWLDTTPEVSPFAYLLTPLRGKQALVIADDKPPVLVTTPAEPLSSAVQSFQIAAKLNDDGTLEGSIENKVQGDDTEVGFRAAFRTVSASEWKDLTQRISYGLGFAGTVSEVIASSPEATSEPFRLAYHYHRKDYPDWENHQINAPLPGIVLPALSDSETKPTAPIWLRPRGETHLEAKVELPKGYSPELPMPIDLKSDFAEYHASYRVKDGSLIAERVFKVKQSEVPIAQYDEYKKFRKTVEDDHNRMIVLSSGELSVGVNTGSGAGGMTAMIAAIRNLPASDDDQAAQFENEARQAMARGEMQSAIALLRRAVAKDPKFTRAWIMLGGFEMAMRHTDGALDAFHKAVDADPKQTLSYKMLGYAQMEARRDKDADKTWRDLIKLNSDDIDAHSNLGLILMRQKRYAEAASEIEAAVKIKPDRANLQHQLGAAYLHGGDEEKSLAAYARALELDPGTEMRNNIAYEMAAAGKKLPEALAYAQKAVREEEEASSQLKTDDLQVEDMQHTHRLGMYWDTLGWIYFRMGTLDQVEKYLSAAWNLLQDPVIGDHLGQLYEKQHKNQQAIHMYRLALAAASAWPGRHDMAETRSRLSHLGGSATSGPFNLPVGGEELSRLRTVKLPRIVPGSANAELMLLFGQGSKLDGVKFVSGSDKLKSADKLLNATKFDMSFPDDGPTRVVRRAILGCYSASGCSLVFMPADNFSPIN